MARVSFCSSYDVSRQTRIAVMLSTSLSGLHWKESLLISIIAPRGVVAVAVAGLVRRRVNRLRKAGRRVIRTTSVCVGFCHRAISPVSQ